MEMNWMCYRSNMASSSVNTVTLEKTIGIVELSVEYEPRILTELAASNVSIKYDLARKTHLHAGSQHSGLWWWRDWDHFLVSIAMRQLNRNYLANFKAFSTSTSGASANLSYSSPTVVGDIFRSHILQQFVQIGKLFINGEPLANFMNSIRPEDPGTTFDICLKSRPWGFRPTNNGSHDPREK